MRTITELQDFIGVTADGVWGPKSQGALDALIHPQPTVAAGVSPAGNYTPDARSIRNMETLLPPVKAVAAKFLEQLGKNHINAQIISGSRTYAEQDALYEQGRSKPGPRVTNARGGWSNHNFGIAFDIGIFNQAGKYLDESPLYAAAGKIGKELGLSWGGDWAALQDEPHFELRPDWAAGMSESALLNELRIRKTSDREIFS